MGEAASESTTITRVLVVALRILLVVVVVFVAFLGVAVGSLMTDPCPSDDTCRPVEQLALGHVPLQAAIGAAGVVVSLRRARGRPQVVALLVAMAASPVAAVAFTAVVGAYMDRLLAAG